MNFVALQMLTSDRAKYLGLIFAVAFSTFLMAQQSAIFAGLMARTTSQINDIEDAHIWVMDPYTQYFDEVKALPDDSVYRVRGVPGVEWAVPLFKGQPRAKAPDGNFRVVVMLGVDDATLVGAPRKLVMGSYEDLRQPDSILIDRVGFEFFFPHQPYRLGNTLEMNDHRVKIVGIFNSSAPFQNFPSSMPATRTPSITWAASAICCRSCWPVRRLASAMRRFAGVSAPPRDCAPPRLTTSVGKPSGTTFITPAFR